MAKLIQDLGIGVNLRTLRVARGLEPANEFNMIPKQFETLDAFRRAIGA